MPLNHSFPYEENIPKYLKFLKTGLELQQKMRKIILSLIMTVCALLSGAQTLPEHAVEYADSADRYIRNENWVDAERMIVNALRLEPANKSNYLLWSNLGIVRDRIGNTRRRAPGVRHRSRIGAPLHRASRQQSLYLNENRTRQGGLEEISTSRLSSTPLCWCHASLAPDCISMQDAFAEAGKDYAAAVSATS